MRAVPVFCARPAGRAGDGSEIPARCPSSKAAASSARLLPAAPGLAPNVPIVLLHARKIGAVDEASEKRYWDSVKNAGEVKRPASHPAVARFAAQRFEYMGRFMDMSGFSRALDVGGGTGFSSYHTPDHVDVTCADFSMRLLGSNPSGSRVQSSAYALPFAAGSFDLVYGWDFLHHLDRPAEAVGEMARVSRKHLAFFEPNAKNPVQAAYAVSNRNERGTLAFGKKYMLGLAKEAGLDVVACDTVGWIFAGATPGPLARILERLPFAHPAGISVAMVCKKPR